MNVPNFLIIHLIVVEKLESFESLLHTHPLIVVACKCVSLTWSAVILQLVASGCTDLCVDVMRPLPQVWPNPQSI